MRASTWCMAFAACTSLHAQVFSCPRTIDAFVADGDQVVVATVVETGAETQPKYGGMLHPVVLQVDETLRGERVARLRVDLLPSTDISYASGTDRGRNAAIVNGWMEHGNRLLVAIEHEDQKNRHAEDWQPGSPPLAREIDLDAEHIEEWRADFVLLTNGADVLRAARAEARRIPAGISRIDTVCIDKTKGFGAGTNLADLMTRGLMVPADDRLEARARAIISGRIETDYDSDSRMGAVQDLGYIRSNENIRYLTAVLHGDEARLRYGAYEALQRLGVAVERPQSVPR